MANFIQTGMQTGTKDAFELAYVASPILLTGGIAGAIPVGIPIMTITQTLSGAASISPASPSPGAVPPLFCSFRPLPGGQLISNEVATFPFWMGIDASNAQIPQPLAISMLMYCPANSSTPYSIKLAVMLALQATLQNHTNLGGSYTVLTPSAIYQNCLLRGITDVSSNETEQAQFAYQWDFVQPLLAFPAGGGVMNNLMTAVTNGVGSLSSSISSLL